MSEDVQRQFVADAQEAGFKVRTYSGRGYYHGFGVTTCVPDELIRATECSLNRDSMGMDVILYPTNGVSREKMDELTKELGVGADDCPNCGADDCEGVCPKCDDCSCSGSVGWSCTYWCYQCDGGEDDCECEEPLLGDYAVTEVAMKKRAVGEQ